MSARSSCVVDQAGEFSSEPAMVCLSCCSVRSKVRKMVAFLRAHLRRKRQMRASSASSSLSSLSPPATSPSSMTASQAGKKVVIFDLGGVVVTPPQRALQKYFSQIGLPRDFIRKVVSHGRSTNVFGRLETGEITVMQFAAEFEKECRLVAEMNEIDFPEQFNVDEMMKFKDPELIPEMLNAVAVLRENGFKTCALTNNYIDDSLNRGYGARGLTALGFYFDEFVESCRLGIRKPDPRIFDEALSRLGTEAKQALFLDDSQVNTRAAEALGMSTILVEETHGALQQLKMMTGVNVCTPAGPIAADVDRITHAYVTTRSNVRFHFTELGSGPPVLLFHDIPDTCASWRNQLPLLAICGFRAIALDLKGFGESSKPADVEQYKLQILCRDTREFLEALGLAQVTLVGRGMGAAFALTFANHNTDRVRAVVGIHTSPLTEGIEAWSCYRQKTLLARCGACTEHRPQAFGVKFSTCSDAERFFDIAVNPSHIVDNDIGDVSLPDVCRNDDSSLIGTPSRLTLASLCPHRCNTRKKPSRKSTKREIGWFRNNTSNWEYNRRLRGRMLKIPALVVTSGQGLKGDVVDVSSLESWIPELEHSHIAEYDALTEKERSTELNKILQEWLSKIHNGENIPLIPL
ncbi:bifunctional epoxide hydrolase 2-like [Diadema setosum]|uniref:bifunctional epoxide hydrolase 2-like n=1 Tax=Diadema setosum TaxID=31175 RepID=UPI003B3AE641